MITLTMLLAGGLALQLWPAFRTWRRVRGHNSSEIVHSAVGSSIYLPPQSGMQGLPVGQVPEPGNGRLSDPASRCGGGASHPQHVPAGTTIATPLVIRGDFSCGTNCRFLSEIRVRGDARIGASSSVAAITADGELVLETGVTIASWAVARGAISLGADGRAENVKSQVAVTIQPGAEVKSADAPIIRIGDIPTAGSARLGGPRLPIAIQSVLEKELDPMGANCWLYETDLHVSDPIVTDKDLIVHGNCNIPSGSKVNESIKASGDLVIDEQVLVGGTLCGDRDVVVGCHTAVQGGVRAGSRLWIGRNCQIGSPTKPSAAAASGKIQIEEGAVVYGTMVSRTGIEAIGAMSRSPREQAGSAKAAKRRKLKRTAMIIVLAVVGSLRGDAQDTQDRGRLLAPNMVDMGMTVVSLGPGETYIGPVMDVLFSKTHKFTPLLHVESLRSDAGLQQNLALASYYDWTPNVFSTQGASVASHEGRPNMLVPQWRGDLRVNYKLPPSRQIVVGLGYTALRYTHVTTADLYNMGMVWYLRRLVILSDAFMNISRPGNVFSASGLMSFQIGVDRRYRVGVSIGGGHEAYRVGAASLAEFRAADVSTSIFYRKWVGRRTGYVCRAGVLKSMGSYARLEASFGLFFQP